MLVLVILAGLGLTSAYLCFAHHWRHAVALLAVWMTVEDLVRKLLPGQPPPVILGKDMILASIYGAMLLAPPRGERPYWPRFTTALVLFGAVAILGCFGPDVPSYLFAMAGLRSYLWYVPVFWLGYYFAGSRGDVLKVMRVLGLLALAVVPLGVLLRQGIVEPGPYLGVFEGGHQYHAFDDPRYGNILLSSSVFGQNARFGRLSLGVFLLAFGLLTGPSRVDWKWWLAAFLGAAGVMASANRGTIYAFGFCAAVLAARPFLLGAPGRAFGRAALLGVALLFSFSALFADVVYFVEATGDEPLNRLEWMQSDLAHAAEKSGLWGHGTGTCSQGISYLPGWDEYVLATGGPGAEQGLAKVIWELGYVGLVAHILLWGAVALSALRAAVRVSGTELDGPAWGAFMYLVAILGISLLGHQVLGDGHVVVMLWFFLGMLHRMPEIVREGAPSGGPQAAPGWSCAAWGPQRAD